MMPCNFVHTEHPLAVEEFSIHSMVRASYPWKCVTHKAELYHLRHTPSHPEQEEDMTNTLAVTQGVGKPLMGL